MSRKGLYLAVGFVWGAVIGLGVALAVAAVAAGVAWLYLFGDAPWPDWAGWAILGTGAVAGLIAFTVCMIVARIVANRHDEGRAAGDGERRGSGFAWILLLAGLAAAGGFAWYEYGRQGDAERTREKAATAARHFPMLLSETHRVAGIAIDWPGGGRDGSAQVALDGLRSGDYRFAWRVRDGLYERPLLAGEEEMRLTAGARQIDIPLPAQRIVDGYRELLNRQDANIMVDEPFLFEAQLWPVLSEEEISRMPAHEVQNLTLGQSPLIHRSSAEFQVRFSLYGETAAWN